MSANFTPNRQPQTPLKPFRYWCQQVLPIVYDDSLSYYELLNKVVDYLNKTMEDVSHMDIDMTNMYNAYDQLQTYVNNYFDNLDVQSEINKKLDEMAESGALSELVGTDITETTKQWLEANVDPKGSAVMIDKTLSIENSAADAFMTGIRSHNTLPFIPELLKNEKITLSVRIQDPAVSIDGNIITIPDNNRYWVYINKEDIKDLITIKFKTNSTNFTFSFADSPAGTSSTLIPVSYQKYGELYTACISKEMFPGDHQTLLLRFGTISTSGLVVRDLIACDGIYIPEKPVISNQFAQQQGTLLTYPENFNHTNKINIYNNNKRFATDYRYWDKYYPTIVKSVYMSPYGSDSGDGSISMPFASFARCMQESPDTIYLLDGVYTLNVNYTFNNDINIIGIGNPVIYFGLNRLIFTDKNISFNGVTNLINIAFIGGAGTKINYKGEEVCKISNCKFLYSANNGLSCNVKNAVLYNCEASYNYIDGLNYHTNNTTNPTGIVEIGCCGHHNGNANNRSSNGSTCHDDGFIIRLNCNYYLNCGGNIAESEAFSCNYGCFCNTSVINLVGSEHFNSDYYVQASGTLYLYNCIGNSDNVVSAINSSNVYSDCNYSKKHIDDSSKFNLIS